MNHPEFCYICVMSRHRSFSFIYNVQRTILLVFFSTTAIAFSIALARLVSWLFPGQFFVLIASLVLYVVLAVVAGSLIHVVSYIPFNLASAFDPIKNDIASGAIGDMEQLGKRICRFTTDFFDFSFLDIAGAFIQTGESDLISHEDLADVAAEMGKFGMLERSKQIEKVERAGRFTRQGREYHLYILPIWFGEHWLGYMGLLSEKRISRFFLEFLMEFENDFLDDQILHVMKLPTKGT